MGITGEEQSSSDQPDGIRSSESGISDQATSSVPIINILYVDDDPDMSTFVRKYLGKTGGFNVTAVSYSYEAIALLNAGNLCDIIISDYHMPGMDGIALLKEIRKFPNPPPFILFTGKGREEVVIEAINNGAAFYLQKGGDTRALFAELTHKIRQAVGKQQAESALRESEEKFRLLFESARDAILIISDGHIVDCNHQAGAFFKSRSDDLIGLTIGDLSPRIQPDGSLSDERWNNSLADVISRGHAELAWRHRRTDGTFFDAEASLNRIDLNRQPCVQVAIRDITERMLAQEELSRRNTELSAAYEELMAAEEERRVHLDELLANQERLAESEQRYRELADLLPQIVFECDLAGRLTYANREGFRTFGYPPGEIPDGMSVLDTLIPEDRAKAVENLSQIPKDGHSVPHEYRAYNMDRAIIPVIIHSSPILKKGQCVGFRGILIDITERKEHEEEIRRSEEKYRTLVDHIQDGVFIIQNGCLQFINPAFAAILGHSVADLTGKKMASIIAPEDMEMVVDRHRRRLAGENVPTQYEFRMIHADGKTRILIKMDIGITQFQGSRASIGTIRDVTRERQVEEAIRESERRLADVINFLPDATFVIDQEGKVIAWNRAMEALTSVSATEILGKGNYEHSIPFYGERRPILVDLALKADDQVEQLYLSMNRTGDRIIGEAYMPNMGGGTVYLWGAASPLRDSKGIIVGAIESIRDITDRKVAEDELIRAREDLERRVADRTAELTSVNAALVTEVEERRMAESALRESEERYRRLIELSPDAIFVHDGTRILFVNPAGIRLLGAVLSDELIGLDVTAIVHPDYLGKRTSPVHSKADASDSGNTTEERFVRTDGSIVDVDVSSAPVVYQGRPAILVVARDITGRKRAAEQLQQYAEEMAGKNKELDYLTNQLLDMNEELDRRVKERTSQVISLMKQKDEFITQIGHDLKTPLTPLRALLPSLIEEEQNPEIREAMSVLLRSVHSIQDQTEKILTIARLSRQDVPVVSEQVLVRPIVDEAVQKNWLYVERKHLTVEIDLAPDSTLTFSLADAGTVFDNLIGNAVKYSKEGGTIRVSSCLHEGTTCVLVADDGIGLTPEEAEHVFDEFYMADNSRHDRSSSGLGLAIVRRLVVLHGGTVHVQSPGKGLGSTFSICLPDTGMPVR